MFILNLKLKYSYMRLSKPSKAKQRSQHKLSLLVLNIALRFLLFFQFWFIFLNKEFSVVMFAKTVFWYNFFHMAIYV